jgi:hypothetical protein
VTAMPAIIGLSRSRVHSSFVKFVLSAIDVLLSGALGPHARRGRRLPVQGFLSRRLA